MQGDFATMQIFDEDLKLQLGIQIVRQSQKETCMLMSVAKILQNCWSHSCMYGRSICWA